MVEPIEKYDTFRVYCRMLGHEVPFSYCRQPGSALVCRNIRSCWEEKIDIEAFLTQHFNAEELEKAFAPREDKLTTLVKLIRKAQKAEEQ